MHSEENKTHFPVHFYARLCSVWVSALSHACRNEVLLHFEGHAKCLLLIIFLMPKTLFNHLSQYTFLSHSEISLIIWKSIMVTKHQVKIVPRHLASL